MGPIVRSLAQDRDDANLKLFAGNREIIITITERSQIIVDARGKLISAMLHRETIIPFFSSIRTYDGGRSTYSILHRSRTKSIGGGKRVRGGYRCVTPEK